MTYDMQLWNKTPGPLFHMARQTHASPPKGGFPSAGFQQDCISVCNPATSSFHLLKEQVTQYVSQQLLPAQKAGLEFEVS